jgi:5-methylcytosine-specific restriction endonuclease McrA
MLSERNRKKCIELYKSGFGYTRISKALGIARSTVIYVVNPRIRKETINRNHKNKLKYPPFYKKLSSFLNRRRKITKDYKHNSKNDKLFYAKIWAFCGRGDIMTFTANDVINEFGLKPKCYLTGEELDLNKPRTYQFDHKIPISRGGTNNLDNLGICTSLANRAKSDQTPDEFLNFCKKVLEYNGYNVSKSSMQKSNPPSPDPKSGVTPS